MNSIEYGKGDMFIPKSILKLLLRGITLYIDDPETYYQYALVHSITASAVREFSPCKKTQFTKYIIMDNIKYPTLPNGWIHGFMSDNDHTVLYPKNGRWIYFNRYGYNNTTIYYIKFIERFYIEKYVYPALYTGSPINNEFTYSPIKNLNFILRFTQCGFCTKFHKFEVSFDNKSIGLAGECYQPLKFVKYHYDDVWFKPSLRSRVTSYARNLKKNTN
jgi:hypothetical protein